MTNEVTAAPEAVKLSRRDVLIKKHQEQTARINQLVDSNNLIVAEITIIDNLANVATGSTVTIGLGVGPTARDVTGVVQGVRVNEDGSKSYKVAYGVGFDSDVATVTANRIKAVLNTAPEAAVKSVEEPAV